MIVEASDTDFEDLIDGQAPRQFRLPQGGLETTEVLHMLRDLARTIRPTFAPASWMIVEDGEILGLCSLVKPPSRDGIDIGYGVAQSCRGRGVATAAVGQVLDWARSDGRVQIVRAETSVDNPASQWVLQRNGFTKSGERHDEEDGALICWSVSV